MTDKDQADNHSPGNDNDPEEVGREAEALQPNRDTQNNRENIAENEMGVPGQDEIDSAAKKSRPLTQPEDNAKVNRVVSDEAAVDEAAAPKARDYLISPRGLRNLFIASNVAGVAIIVFILTLASSGPQGRYTPADETQYQRTLLEATDTISTSAKNEGEPTARIPIDEAITLVAKKGLGPVAEALAAPPATSAVATPAPTPAEAAAPAPTKPANAAEGPAEGKTAQKNAAQAGAAGALAAQPASAQADGAPAAATPAALDLSAGETVFTTNCASCHQTTGLGVAGAFPPLKGHVPALYNADRSYLVNLLLYGLQGEVQIESQPYNGVMPAWQQLSDDDLANVLNYVSNTWGNKDALQNFQPYTAADVTPVRDAGLSSDEVYALREKLGLSGKN